MFCYLAWAALLDDQHAGKQRQNLNQHLAACMLERFFEASITGDFMAPDSDRESSNDGCNGNNPDSYCRQAMIGST